MSSQDKAFQVLLDLGNPAERRTRAEQLDRALRAALLMMEADAVVMTTTSPRAERLVLHAGSSTPAALPIPVEGSEVVRRMTESCVPVVVNDLPDDTRLAATDGCPGVEAGPVLFTPVRRRDPDPAYLAVYRRRGRARYTLNDNRLMLLLAAWLSSALENHRLSTGTEKLAVTDDLTEVYNYRYLKTALRREIRRASRFGHEMSVVKIDVDHLKAFSDESGKLKGSLLLKELALVLAQQVRSFDVLARHGDDEFMLILPETSREGATEVAERMRTTVEGQAFSNAAPGAVTVSLGVASFPRDGADIKALVTAADRALQRAKQGGRNCVATPKIQAA